MRPARQRAASRRAALLAAVACLTAVLPAAAAPSPPAGQTAGAPGLDELQRLRDRLAAASGDLSLLDGAVSSATAELDQIEGRLSAAAAGLAAVRGELADAETRRAAAAAEAAVATDRLLAATADLDAARADLSEQEAVLAGRIRSMWKYGASNPGTLMLEGLARSADLHEASLTMRTVGDLVESDHALVDRAVVATRDESRARTLVAEVQRDARRAEGRAAAERDRVADLVARQAALVASIDAERDAKSAVLALLASDQAAASRLVEQLNAQVVQMAGALAAALLAANPDARFDGPMPTWAAGLPPRGRELAPAIVGAAGIAGVDARLFAALVWSESNFHLGAVSHAGAIGLAQLMPGTAAGMGVDPWDPIQNLVGGARYLRAQLQRFGGADLALAAYNAGPARVDAAGLRIPQITETQVYVLRVLTRYEALAALD